MNCVICRHGKTEAGTATATMERDGCVIVIRNAPAQVCDNCGEAYFGEDVTANLLKLSDEAGKAGTPVTVRDYAA